ASRSGCPAAGLSKGRGDLTSWGELPAGQEGAHAAPLEHRGGDQGRLRLVMTRLDEALQLSRLHSASHIGSVPSFISSWYSHICPSRAEPRGESAGIPFVPCPTDRPESCSSTMSARSRRCSATRCARTATTSP